MRRQVLSTESDPAFQDSDVEQYDVLVVARPLHASENPKTILGNAHRLLKSEGKLILPTASEYDLFRDVSVLERGFRLDIMSPGPGSVCDDDDIDILIATATENQLKERLELLESSTNRGLGVLIPYGGTLIGGSQDDSWPGPCALHEKPNLNLVTLAFKTPDIASDICVRCTARVILRSLAGSPYDREFEYVERNGLLNINRVHNYEELNRQVQSKPHEMISKKTMGESPPLALAILNSGLIDSIRWEEDAAYYADLGPDEAEMRAASLPTTGITAYYALVKLAQLQKGEKILIHSATGGTGQMAVQIAQSIGAEVYVTVGSDDKKRLVEELYGIPHDHIFYSRDTRFARDIYHATDGRGVDVMLNSLSKEALVASWECLAPFGRFLELGKMDIEENSKLPMGQFSRNVTFHAVAIDHLYTERPQVSGKILQAVMDLVVEGRIKTASPLLAYPVSELEDAFRSMQSGKNTGKIVITFSPNNVVPAQLDWATEYIDGVETYLDFEELLEKAQVDVVVVSSITDAHARQTVANIKKGLHVMRGNDVSNYAMQSSSVVAAYGESKKTFPKQKVMCGFSRSFDASYREAKERLDANEMGKPVDFRSQTADLFDDTAFFTEYVKTSGGIFLDCSIHCIDLMNWFYGEDAKIKSIQAVGVAACHPSLMDCDDRDNAIGLIEFYDNRIAQLYCTNMMAAVQEDTTEIICERGSVRINMHGQKNFVEVHDSHGARRKLPKHYYERFREAFATEANEFIAACIKRHRCPHHPDQLRPRCRFWLCSDAQSDRWREDPG
uniref:Enoyl reductase (ER) domain-containing protein n=1 Tax=Bionectria ochroleuca TaxID=29856 RepID=A0A8H7KEM4_BIOOC